MLPIFGIVAGNKCMSEENVNSWKSRFLKKQKLRPVRPLMNSRSSQRLKPIKPWQFISALISGPPSNVIQTIIVTVYAIVSGLSN